MHTPGTGRRRLAVVSAALVIAATTGTLLGGIASAGATPHLPPPNAGGNSFAGALRSTAELTSLADEVQRFPSRAGSLSGEIKAVASAREKQLLDLIQNHPDQAGAALLTDRAEQTLRGVDPGDIEHKVTLGGGLTVIAGDGGSRYFLTRQGQQPLPLYSNGTFPSVSQRSVTITGYQLGYTVFIEAASSTTSATTTSSTAPTTGMVGKINAAVIVTYFSDTSNPFSMSNIQSTFSGSPGHDVDSYFSEVSYSKTNLVPSFYGPFQLSMSQSTGCASLNTLAQASVSAANSSLSFSNVQRLIFVVDCPNLGDWASVGQVAVSTPQGTIQSGESWISAGDETTPYGYAHELGHNAGFSHADWAVCDPDMFDPPTNFGPNCPTAAYGDTFDTMGSAPWQWQDTPHFDAYHKAVAGWFSPANYPTVSSPGSYTYTLAPIEAASSGTIALNIPRGDSGTSFTVEYRQPVGFDAWLSNCNDVCNVTQGASIKLVGGLSGSADTHALDMTPESQPWSTQWDEKDYYRDEALLPGKTFTDPEYGIQISVTSAGANGLTVQVTIPSSPCTHASPSVTAAPLNTSVSPGQTATWNVTVTNNYSLGCPPAQFRFRSYGKYGSNPYTDPGLITLASGASTSLTMSLPVPTSLVYGSYSDQGALQANALADPGATFGYSFTVTGPTDASAPTPPQHLSARAKGAQLVGLNWLSSTDQAGVGSYRVFRNGVFLTTTTGTSFLDSSVAPSASYTYQVEAVNWSGALSAYSAPASASTPAVTDTTPPGDVPGLTLTSVGAHQVGLKWRPASDNIGVAYYAVVLDNSSTTYLPATSTGTTYGDLWSGVPTSFYVLAYDADGNASSFWDAVANGPQVTPAASGGSAPLPPPAPLATTVTPQQVALVWPPVAGANSYTVYRDQVRFGTATTASYVDSSAVAGASENYTVVATDTSGNNSAPSPETTVYMPAATASSNPPSLAVTSPSGGASLSGPVTLTTTTTDPSGIKSAKLLVDDAVVATSTAAPFSFSFDSSSLANGNHTLSVSATGGDGDTGTSASVPVSVSNPDTSPPTVPEYVQPMASGPNQMTLSWAASTDNVGVTCYRILRNGTVVGTSTSTTYSDTTLSPSTAYTYTVEAVDGAGNVSAQSPSAQASTLPADNQPPTAPSALAAGAVTGSQVNLTWAASSDNVGVTGYNVYRAVGSGDFALEGGSTTTSFTDNGLTPGTSYLYYVQAYDAAGNVSSASNTADPPAGPSSPKNLTASPQSSSQIALSWAAGAGPSLVGYKIFRSSGTSSPSQVATVSSSSTTYTDTGLSPATTYNYYVEAYDSAGNVSVASNQASATTLNAPATLKGCVSGSRGAISGAVVSLAINGSAMTTTTNKSGSYSFANIPAGTYVVTYSASRFATQSVTVTMPGGTTTTENVVLTKG